MTQCKQCGKDCKTGDFCCSGCEAACAARESISAEGQYSALAQDLGNGTYQLELAVEGIHCASCIRLIENALAAQPDVTAARVNMTTERLAFSWTGEKSRGDALAAEVSKLGYKLFSFDAEKENSGADTEKTLIKAIAASGFAAGNLMLISVGLWSSTAETMGFATRDFFHWVSALIALPIVLYSGQPFFRSAFAALRGGHTNMDVPISLAVILASVMSVSETIRHGDHVYFDSAVMLLFFLLIGRYLDARAKGKARASASRLLSQLAGMAAVKEAGALKRVPISQLKSGMQVLVTAGENFPADGIITAGETDMDMSLISGETIPLHAGVGTDVFAGTLNLTAPVDIEVTKASENSLLSAIVRMMEVAEQGAAKYVRIADKAAALYTPVVHIMGFATFAGWWLLASADWQVALLHAVTVLIITCPCALGLAVPVVQVLASGVLLKNGVLLKSGDALERLAGIDTVVFDKTGTLTVGRPELLPAGYSPAELKLAASLAANSRHPLSKALAEAYTGELITLEVKEHPGKGLSAFYDGQEVRVGSRAWCGTDGTKNGTDGTESGTRGTDTVLELFLWVGGQTKKRFTFADQLRSDAVDTITRLKAAGLDCILLSGDRKAVAGIIGGRLGIERIIAEVTPAEKCAELKALKEKGRSVLMVGDGLNDAPALAAADASMSPSSAVDITQNTADIVFQGERLMPVYDTLLVARRSNALVRENFALAILYNIVAVPMAVMGYVTPMVAAAAMSGSSLIVIMNAFRLTLGRKKS
ncbi:heavy metal translocating P-type ATPase [Kordiimonas pumila]|uniref:Heavy metal translocating P-type ATPase n=1 Tax=Kordiimonas pumila TaxID=2161677 RepID=A0ABV7D775_9PROT|nr:heavy metal translocating P-type ATPase [Kordiimonas pumila]